MSFVLSTDLQFVCIFVTVMMWTATNLLSLARVLMGIRLRVCPDYLVAALCTGCLQMRGSASTELCRVSMLSWQGSRLWYLHMA